MSRRLYTVDPRDPAYDEREAARAHRPAVHIDAAPCPGCGWTVHADSMIEHMSRCPGAAASEQVAA